MKLIHPGRILKREMLARGLSANKLSLSLRVPSGRITQILNGKRGVSAVSLQKQRCDLPGILAIVPNFGLTSNQDTIWL
jgi:hypothetical protein